MSEVPWGLPLLPPSPPSRRRRCRRPTPPLDPRPHRPAPARRLISEQLPTQKIHISNEALFFDWNQLDLPHYRREVLSANPLLCDAVERFPLWASATGSRGVGRWNLPAQLEPPRPTLLQILWFNTRRFFTLSLSARSVFIKGRIDAHSTTSRLPRRISETHIFVNDLSNDVADLSLASWRWSEVLYVELLLRHDPARLLLLLLLRLLSLTSLSGTPCASTTRWPRTTCCASGFSSQWRSCSSPWSS